MSSKQMVYNDPIMGDIKSVKKPNGRPLGVVKFDFNEANLKLVKRLAASVLTQSEVAAMLEITEKTLIKYKNLDEGFNTAWKQGRAELALLIDKSLIRQAKKGDIGAIRWWESTRRGLSEKVKTENETTIKVESLESHLRKEKDVTETTNEDKT